MRNFYSLFIAWSFMPFAWAQQYHLSSPDSKTTVTISFADKCLYSVAHNGVALINPSAIGLNIHDRANLLFNPKVTKKELHTVDDMVYPVVHEKRKVIVEQYNEIKLDLKSGLTLSFRAFNNGVAYRWETHFKEKIIIDSELVNYTLASPVDTVYYPEEESFYSHNERLYIHYAAKDITNNNMASLPALINTANNIKLLITESDLYDYAGLWLKGSGSAELVGIHPNFPAEEKETSGLDRVVTKRENYVAKTNGRRTFPWRIIGIAENDVDLINNQLSYLLATGTNEDFSWVKPGRVAWDWWNGWNCYGVDFKAGINTATYKYFVDFAAKYNLEYIILDAGWSEEKNLLATNPELNMDELALYAKQKRVDLILWVSWLSLDKQLDTALKKFSAWNVKGIKVDFMQRDDQEMVNFYERVAKTASTYHMLVDFHGAFKPTGLQRKYPNALTREGVFGNENSKWDTKKRIAPPHNVMLPFIRMAAGPMDYTPGAMLNAQTADWAPIYSRPMSLGTRCQQLAMYVVYESPLQMLCDNPSNYYREKECTEFIAKVPSVWEETIPLNGKVGEYISVARQATNGDWYVGAMTDWSSRDMELSFSFLENGNYQIEIFQDGINANRVAQDYTKIIQSIKKGDTLKIHLAPGGGWAARIYKN
ncbi:MAG TPA: glycoside hydrolase family 97 protein [Puia sp.]|nr:glycoside hydrolase family 97 protein [Puia sp.]